MAEIILSTLMRQTLLLSLACALLLHLRGSLRRHFGAGIAYASWALVPLVLLIGSLPAQAPVRAVVAPWVQQVSSLGQAAPLTAPILPSHAAAWLALWVIGAGCVLLYMARQQWRLQRSLQREGEHWIGDDEQGPALIGLWPARLLLPRDFAERFDAAQQALVLAHEELHRRRFDNHWNALAAVLLLLNWFNPVAWLAARALRSDQELACDAAVMAQHPGCEADYARALLAAQRGTVGGLALPWSHWTSSHPLIERITMLRTSTVSRARRRLGRLALVTLGLCAALGAQSLRAASENASVGPNIQLDMKFDIEQMVDGARVQMSSAPRLQIASGTSGTIRMGSKPDQASAEQIEIEIRPRLLDKGQIELSFSINGGLPQPLSLKPRLITADGVKARIETASPGQPTLKIDVTPSLVVKPPQP